MRPILSILIPTRNRARYVAYAIQSALGISDSGVEILVSNNCSEDDTRAICRSFIDPRLRVFDTDRLLPMHANYESLIQRATGEWIYFLGDDDAIMPHAAAYLRHITLRHPLCEALVTPRAYYFWKNAEDSSGGIAVKCVFENYERWRDSKQCLIDLLDCKTNYFSSPQNYSGGFQRRSLIRRVLNSQNGIYYKSVTPDAYSALMGCLHTYRFLESGIPVAWVGTSDGKERSSDVKSETKDRIQDFFGLHNEDDLIIHRSLGDLRYYTLPLIFYEAYLSAIPTTSYKELNRDRLLYLLADAKHVFESTGESQEYLQLLDCLGFDPTEIAKVSRKNKRRQFFERNRERLWRYFRKLMFSFRGRPQANQKQWSRHLVSNSYSEFPNILTANAWAQSAYDDFLRECI